MPISYDHPDWFYLKYPFHGRVFYHPKAQIAFAKTKKGAIKYSHFMYGFVDGTPSHAVANLQLPTEEGVSYPTDETQFEDAGASTRAIQDLFEKWRFRLFSDQRALRYILFRLAQASSLENQAQGEFSELFNFLMANGLFNSLPKEEKTKRQIFWDQVQTCFLDCAKGLTVSEHRSKYNGYSSFEANMVQWRFYITSAEAVRIGTPEYEEKLSKIITWIETRGAEINELILNLRTEIEKKAKCASCQFGFVGKIPPHTVEYLSAYIARYRRMAPEKFYGVFVSALVFAWVRLETTLMILAMNDMYGRHATWKPSDYEKFKKLIYFTDDNHQRYVNAIAHAMIECLVEEQGDVVIS